MNIKKMKNMKNKLSFLFLFALALVFSACEEKGWHQDDLELSPVKQFVYTDYSTSTSGVEHTYNIYTELDYYVESYNSFYYKYEYTNYEYDYTEVYTEPTEEEIAEGVESTLSTATHTVSFRRYLSTAEYYSYEFTYETVKKKGVYTVLHFIGSVQQDDASVGVTTGYSDTYEYVDPNFVTPVVEE